MTPSRPVAAVPARTTTATANNAVPRLRLFPRFIFHSPRPTYHVLDACCVILWREEGGHDPTPMVVTLAFTLRSATSFAVGFARHPLRSPRPPPRARPPRGNSGRTPSGTQPPDFHARRP